MKKSKTPRMEHYRRTRIVASLAVLSALTFSGTALAATATDSSPISLNGNANRPAHSRMRSGNAAMRPAVVGTVTAVNGNTLTVSAKQFPTTRPMASSTPAERQAEFASLPTVTYAVDASNAKITKGFGTTTETLSVSQIAVNDTVAVTGTVSGTSVTATAIRDSIKFPAGGAGKGPGKGFAGKGPRTGTATSTPFYGGKITAINGTSFTITSYPHKPRGSVASSAAPAPVTYTVNASGATITQGFGKSAQALAVADLTTNETVMIKGTLDATTETITATSVNVRVPRTKPASTTTTTN